MSVITLVTEGFVLIGGMAIIMDARSMVFVVFVVMNALLDHRKKRGVTYRVVLRVLVIKNNTDVLLDILAAHARLTVATFTHWVKRMKVTAGTTQIFARIITKITMKDGDLEISIVCVQKITYVLFVVKNALVHRGVTFVNKVQIALQVQLDKLAAAPCAFRASTRPQQGALLAPTVLLASFPLLWGPLPSAPAPTAFRAPMPYWQAISRAANVHNSAIHPRAALL
jgi:hypothetical protein